MPEGVKPRSTRRQPRLPPRDARYPGRQLAGAPAPDDLLVAVEITGPYARKMVINASSGARVFIADLEDASSPTWSNVVDGHQTSTTRCAARYPSKPGWA